MIARKMATDELQFALRYRQEYTITLYLSQYPVVGVQRQNDEDGICNEEHHLWDFFLQNLHMGIARLHSR